MKRWIIYTILLTIGICVLIVAYFAVNTIIYNAHRDKRQEDLAKLLGVQIENYPYPHSFPVGYFSSVLKPGMTIEMVHQLIQGYEAVLHCGRISEVYYFYNSEIADDTIRLDIIYDDQGFFKRFEGEDPNSRTIQIIGCEPGIIIPEKEP